ncbi:transmembrane protein 136-like isoform X2 [Pomacea canaliculata]|nr:transmembrane protein 136-like isoform X2 [Pomacea canaliculata]
MLRWLEPRRKPEWHCRMITVAHALLITILSAWAAFIQGPWPFTNAGGSNTPLQVKVATVCLGYFLFDFSWCLYFQTEGLPMLLHHSLSLLGLIWTLVAGKYGTELTATICGSEVTNPLLQLRWFLRETGHYHTILGETVDHLFMFFFFFIRIGIGSVLLYCYFQQPTDTMGRFGAICIYLIGWMFWLSICQYAIRKYRKKLHSWRERRQITAQVAVTEKPTVNLQDEFEFAIDQHKVNKKSFSYCSAEPSNSHIGWNGNDDCEQFRTLQENHVHLRTNGVTTKK